MASSTHTHIGETAYEAWDERWSDDEGRAKWLEPEETVRALVPTLKARGARTVLDLGCGVGRHALFLAEEGFRVHAIDAAEQGLRFARQSAAERHLTIALNLGVMTSLPYASGLFDYVLSWNVIYHGDRSVQRRAIDEIKRVIRPDGLFQGTILSKRHVRCGQGRAIAPDTYVIDDSDERRHPHCYSSAAQVVADFEGFEMLSLVDAEHEAPGTWHWHLVAERTP